MWSIFIPLIVNTGQVQAAVAQAHPSRVSVMFTQCGARESTPAPRPRPPARPHPRPPARPHLRPTTKTYT
ncbi:unnamed protein product, partial [Brenthis ino]